MRELKHIDPRECLHHPVYFPKAFKYAKLMEAGVIFPPVKVHIDDQGRFRIKNGAHRCMAAKLANKKLWVKLSRRNKC